jgi:putative ABC transport system permease protein
MAWPGGDVLGRCVRIGADSMPCRTVVGVVRDARFQGAVDRPIDPAYFIPYAQAEGFRRPGAVMLRTRPDAPATSDEIARAIRALDPELPPATVTTMGEHLAWMTRPYEVGRATFAVYGVLAAVIALTGLGGVLAYVVAQDRTAFAVRIALGAPAARVIRPVIVRAVSLVVGGMALGVAVLWTLRERLDALLFQTTVLDPLVVGLVLLMGTLMALVAAYAPVREILRIEPMRVLREE